MRFRTLWGAVCFASCTATGQAGQVVIAQTAPMSGLEATQGRAYAAGMRLHFASVNKAGGIHGNTIELVTADDQGRPEQTLKLTEELVAQHKPLALAGFFGTANVAGLVVSGVLERHKLALVGYRQSDLRTDAPHLYTTRAPLEDEIRKFTEHLATIGIRRVALFHEEGQGADRVVGYTQQAATRTGALLVAKASYPHGTVRVRPAAEALAAASPQAVIVVASGGAAAAFIEQFRSAGGTSQIFAASTADIEQLAKRLGEEQMQGVVIAQVTPNPYKVTNRIGKELADLVGQGGAGMPPISYATMEGFITAKVIAEAMKRMGPMPTRDGFAKALEKIDHLDLGGYAVGYGPEKRAGSRWVELTIVTSGGRIRQ